MFVNNKRNSSEAGIMIRGIIFIFSILVYVYIGKIYCIIIMLI